jgi:hypothetical protein
MVYYRNNKMIASTICFFRNFKRCDGLEGVKWAYVSYWKNNHLLPFFKHDSCITFGVQNILNLFVLCLYDIFSRTTPTDETTRGDYFCFSKEKINRLVFIYIVVLWGIILPVKSHFIDISIQREPQIHTHTYWSMFRTYTLMSYAYTLLWVHDDLVIMFITPGRSASNLDFVTRVRSCPGGAQYYNIIHRYLSRRMEFSLSPSPGRFPGGGARRA